MKTFKFLLVFRTRENTDVFVTIDNNIYGIHNKRVNILCVLSTQWKEVNLNAPCSLSVWTAYIKHLVTLFKIKSSSIIIYFIATILSILLKLWVFFRLLTSALPYCTILNR